MADAVTLTTLISDCRTEGEIDDDYWDDTAVTRRINKAIKEMWDRILAVPNGKDFLLKPSRLIPVAVSRTGTGDSIAISGTTCTLTDSAGAFLAAEVGKTIHLSGCTNPANDGSFIITARTSGTQITYENAEGVAETSSLAWKIDSMTVGLPTDCGVQVEMVEVQDSSSNWYQIFPANLQDRQDNDIVVDAVSQLSTRYRVLGDVLMLTPTPTWAGSLRIWYVPVPVDLSSGSDTADFWFGWDRFVTNKVCQWHSRARGETEEANSFRDDAMLALDGILKRAMRRTAGANRIRDIYAERNRRPWGY